jgi:hypothetical protein
VIRLLRRRNSGTVHDRPPACVNRHQAFNALVSGLTGRRLSVEAAIADTHGQLWFPHRPGRRRCWRVVCARKEVPLRLAREGGLHTWLAQIARLSAIQRFGSCESLREGFRPRLADNLGQLSYVFVLWARGTAASAGWPRRQRRRATASGSRRAVAHPGGVLTPFCPSIYKQL